MSIAQSSLLLFPPAGWWRQAAQHHQVLIQDSGAFCKMTARNRYRVATANGPLLLSVPVSGGRTLKAPMNEVQIDYSQDWPKQHWRSLFSAYGRAPFFEHYGPVLEMLLHQKHETLAALNWAALHWVRKELRLKTAILPVGDDTSAATVVLKETAESSDRYAQVFEDRHGFLPNLSIIDLLMNEGPAAASLLF